MQMFKRDLRKSQKKKNHTKRKTRELFSETNSLQNTHTKVDSNLRFYSHNQSFKRVFNFTINSHFYQSLFLISSINNELSFKIKSFSNYDSWESSLNIN